MKKIPEGFWGPKRVVEVFRAAGQRLGVDICGGTVQEGNGLQVTGLFVKTVVPDSPVQKTGQFNVGDRIVEVRGQLREQN